MQVLRAPSLLRCADGIQVEWQFSTTPLTTLTSEKILILKGEQGGLARILAHGELTQGQVLTLFRSSKACYKRALHRRRVAVIIKVQGLEPYCEGVGEKKILEVVSKNQRNRDAVIRALLSAA